MLSDFDVEVESGSSEVFPSRAFDVESRVRLWMGWMNCEKRAGCGMMDVGGKEGSQAGGKEGWELRSKKKARSLTSVDRFVA